MKGPKGMKALVLGAGRSGAAAARLLRRLGVEPSIYDDQRPWDRKGQAAELTDAAALYGPGELPPLDRFGQVVVSPGVPVTHRVVKEAAEQNIPVLGELELAWRNQDLPLAAVTGSNGKSTVTELASHILEKLGERPACAGNIGKPFSEAVLEMIEGSAGGEEPDPDGKARGRSSAAPGRGPYRSAVLEVSSFQLETTRDFRANAAAFLNFSPDHQDRHGDMGEYFRLKGRIFENQTEDDTAVINEDDTVIRLKNTRARRFGFSLKARPGYGAWAEQVGGECVIRVADGAMVLAERPWSGFQLLGTHNQENLMAAVGLVMGLGRGAEEALDAAVGFTVPDHRLEFVGSWNGIDWYDDSKATNSGAVATALKNFADGAVVIILGGRDKDMDFRPLKAPVRAKAHHIILMGEAKERLKSSLRGMASMTSVNSMEDAVKVASERAQPGDTVLLSPACASFDMFSGYKERGDVFQREVRRQNDPLIGLPMSPGPKGLPKASRDRDPKEPREPVEGFGDAASPPVEGAKPHKGNGVAKESGKASPAADLRAKRAARAVSVSGSARAAKGAAGRGAGKGRA
ncbi:MAG: UDP-N-acetylmuramoyl-L-alanine--D-glutamate ligase [Deltaproteobacteria bacterium]|jgi:UDP-N-acetylmuramoylalanine--D-glutamate ligase|nr:UDP-N-acetylmuramoyl-L-alanine--D-glutamate ligase [Deltaproteobacteria bacterium]